jgi:hypothetical protein
MVVSEEALVEGSGLTALAESGGGAGRRAVDVVEVSKAGRLA